MSGELSQQNKKAESDAGQGVVTLERNLRDEEDLLRPGRAGHS